MTEEFRHSTTTALFSWLGGGVGGGGGGGYPRTECRRDEADPRPNEGEAINRRRS